MKLLKKISDLNDQILFFAQTESQLLKYDDLDSNSNFFVVLYL